MTFFVIHSLLLFAFSKMPDESLVLSGNKVSKRQIFFLNFSVLSKCLFQMENLIKFLKKCRIV